MMAAKRTQQSINSENKFRARLAELGAVPLYKTWDGSQFPHAVLCSAGHKCYPRPNDVTSGGQGPCRECAGQEPRVAERKFRNRLAQLGATPVYAEWRGVNSPHDVICNSGHECRPRPGDVNAGQGICRACSTEATRKI